MFSETKMVRVRRAVESLYDGQCSITEFQEYTKPNKATSHRKVVVLKDQPCRLSFESVSAVDQTETGAIVQQVIKLHIAPGITVSPGSKISVTQNNVTTDYSCSGKPAVYSTHQEIDLKLFEGWS